MRKRFRIAALVVLASGLACGAAHAVTAEPMDLEPDVLAKIAKERARATSLSGAARAAGKRGDALKDDPVADCGAIAIGNVTNNRIGFAPTDVQVVIVGDVINANNKCK